MHNESIAIISANVTLNGRTTNAIKYTQIHHIQRLVLINGYILTIKNTIANILCTFGNSVNEKDVSNNRINADIFQLVIEYK